MNLTFRQLENIAALCGQLEGITVILVTSNPDEAMSIIEGFPKANAFVQGDTFYVRQYLSAVMKHGAEILDKAEGQK